MIVFIRKWQKRKQEDDKKKHNLLDDESFTFEDKIARHNRI